MVKIRIDPNTFRFTSDSFEYNVDATVVHRKVDLVRMQSIEVQCNKNYCVPRDAAGKQLQKDYARHSIYSGVTVNACRTRRTSPLLSTGCMCWPMTTALR